MRYFLCKTPNLYIRKVLCTSGTVNITSSATKVASFVRPKHDLISDWPWGNTAQDYKSSLSPYMNLGTPNGAPRHRVA